MTESTERVQYGFSSIGYADASLAEMSALGTEFGLDFIELRALGGSTDLPAYFTSGESGKEIRPTQPRVRLVATDLHLMNATGETIDTFLQTVDVATKLGACYVRVFGGGSWGVPISEAALEHAARVAGQCRTALRARSADCEILLETHSAFSSPELCLKLNEKLDEPLNLLWDSHHTWRNAGESPRESWQRIGSLVRHIHFSDSISKAPELGYRCVLPGTGEYPAEALRQVLVENGYCHGVSLEWEKLWHPELPHVRTALQEFDRLFKIRKP
jgi:sugar phosphate isomerase/epimerase